MPSLVAANIFLLVTGVGQPPLGIWERAGIRSVGAFHMVGFTGHIEELMSTYRAGAHLGLEVFAWCPFLVHSFAITPDSVFFYRQQGEGRNIPHSWVHGGSYPSRRNGILPHSSWCLHSWLSPECSCLVYICGASLCALGLPPQIMMLLPGQSLNHQWEYPSQHGLGYQCPSSLHHLGHGVDQVLLWFTVEWCHHPCSGHFCLVQTKHIGHFLWHLLDDEFRNDSISLLSNFLGRAVRARLAFYAPVNSTWQLTGRAWG